jgi:NADPH2:quinone reductase
MGLSGRPAGCETVRGMRAWRVHEFGEPAAALQLDEVPDPSAGPGELLVRVAAITLNFNDVDGVRGRYRTVAPPLPYTPGMEVLGRVEDAGPGAESWIGKRVVSIPNGAFGGYAELAIGPSAMAFEMPPASALPDTPAAAVYFPFHLSWLALHERARLQEGETVLIHAAAGGIGSAAVQLATLAGARVIATAGSAAKLELCRSLGADVAINYTESDFVDAVLDATDGRGVDVAFDSVGGEVTTKTFRCMAFNGRHLLVGFASGIEAEDEGIVPRPVLFGNFSLYGVCHAYVDDPAVLKAMSGYNFPSHADGERVHAQILRLVLDGSLRPVVGNEVAFGDLPRALQAMADRESMGRNVVLVAGAR